MKSDILNIRTVGALSFFEAERDIPFQIKRIYYISGEKAGVKRGFHAHKTLRQFLFCPYGAIEIALDDGAEKTVAVLHDPKKGLLLNEGCVWREMTWLKDDSVLCVAASGYYDENDYIRDYDEFSRIIIAHKNCGGGVNGNNKLLPLPQFDFKYKRIFYIHGEITGAHRGFHAHKTLKQVLYCPIGKIDILLDDGVEKTTIRLDSPEKVLTLPARYWHEMLWKSDNAVLCVAASGYYDENDYIRDYDEFLKWKY